MGKVIFDKVKKHYPGNPAATVRDLSLTINDGEFLVLVGPSGCGKSTALRMMAGLVTVTSGRILIDDRNITDLPPKDRDISMVFQNYALFPHMNVYENIAFGLKIRGADKSEIAEKVNAAAELLGITNLLDKRPKEVSGGQRQRVALGRAIVRNPKVFLFDEPLSNLDAKLRTQMRAELSKLHRRLKTTTIYVTHDQCEAMTMADRIAVLNDGVLQQCGEPLDVYERPANTFVATFIGPPPMNLFSGAFVQDKGLHYFKTQNTLIPVSAQTAGLVKNRKDTCYTLGIRPEHIYPERRKPSGVKFGPAIPSEIELAESMGNGVCLHCNSAGLVFQSTQKHDFPVHAGDHIEMAFAIDEFCLFDEAGAAIAAEGGV